MHHSSPMDSDHVQIQVEVLPASGGFPNNPRLPLLIYHRVFLRDEEDLASTWEQLFRRNNWRGTWRNGVFSYHHFHSNAHEVLGIAQGSAEIQFGGPEGLVVTIQAGDLAILPSGTGHKKVTASDDFLVVGAYPAGQEDYDILRGDPAELHEAEQRIAAVPIPTSDPVYRSQGPLFRHWN